MKRFVVVIAALLVTLVAPVLLQGQTSSADQQLRQLYSTLTSSMVKADVAALSKIYADDFVAIRFDGFPSSKMDVMKYYADGTTKFDSITPADFKVRVYGDTGVITTIEDTKATLNGKRIDGQARVSYFCVKRGGAWQIVLRQMTPMPSKPAGAAGK